MECITLSIFETGFGIAWFLGSWLLGVLYDVNPTLLVVVSVAVQLAAIRVYMLSIQAEEKEAAHPQDAGKRKL